MVKTHFIEPDTGIVHIINDDMGCGEFTLCGLAFDEPSSERGEEPMRYTDAPCNCEECIAIAQRMLASLKKEVRRLKKEGRIK